MNPKTVIYIILSAILLYLYYRSGGLDVFAGFIVLVSSTLIFGKDMREGAKNKSGGGGDKECEKMGFKQPKLVKNSDGDVDESLEKEMKTIKKVADKYWPYDAKGDSKDETEKESIKEYVNIYFKVVKENKPSEEDGKNAEGFTLIAQSVWSAVYDPDESKRKKLNLKPDGIPKGYLTKAVSGGNTVLKTLEKVGKSDELKNAGAKKINKYLICLCKQWTAIFKILDGMAGGKKDGGGKKKKSKNDEDEEDDSTKKKKKSKTKKDEDEEEE